MILILDDEIVDSLIPIIDVQFKCAESWLRADC